MMRWNREAAMLGIPDLPEEGFKHVGDRKIKPQGGGGGGGHTTSTVTQQSSNVPDYAKPQFMEILGKGKALSEAPYQAYGGERIAQFSPLQQQAFQQAGQQGVAPQIGQASGLAGLASMQALQAGNYQPGTFTPMAAQAPQLSMFQMGAPSSVRAQPLQQFQMGAPIGVGTQTFAQPGAAEQFMSPYMQNVVDIQKREAQRTADIAGTERGAQAVRAGAFGGSRQAIMDAEAQRNLAQQMGDIQATGSQAAFQQAQQQFNQEQQARLQAQMANQAAGLTAGQANLQAALGTQQLGAQTGLQAQLANQQAGLTAGQANLQAALGTQQLGAQTGMQAQLANQQALMDAQRAFEQSRQFGAGQGLQGLQTALQGAGQLGQLGGQQFGQEMDIMGARQQMGAAQQEQQQRIFDQQYADFQAQRDFPYQQLGFYSDLLRGAGGTTRSIYQQPGMSPLQTAAGLGSIASGLGGMFAKGGEVKRYADGGVTALLGDQELAQRAQDPMTSPMGQLAAQDQMAQNAMLRAAAPEGMPQPMVEDTLDPVEAALVIEMQEALNEGDRQRAEALAETIERRREKRMQEEQMGVAAAAEMGDIPPGGITGMPMMAMGGEVQRFSTGQEVRTPYTPRKTSGQRMLDDLLQAGADAAENMPDAPQIRFAREGTRQTIDAFGNIVDAVADTRALPMSAGYLSQRERDEAARAARRQARQQREEASQRQMEPLPEGIQALAPAGVTPSADRDRLLLQRQDPTSGGLAEVIAMQEAAQQRAAEQAAQDQIATLEGGAPATGASVASAVPTAFDAARARAAQEQTIREGEAAALGDVDKEEARYDEFIRSLGVRGEAEEKRIRDSLESIKGEKNKAGYMALFQAGLSILSADPSRGALAAIGEGSLKGLGAYKGDIKDLEARRERMVDKLDTLDGLRRQEAIASEEGRQRIAQRRSQVRTEFGKEYRAMAKQFDIDIPLKAAETLADQTFRAQQNALNREALAARSAGARRFEELTAAERARITQAAANSVDSRISKDFSLQLEVKRNPARRDQLIQTEIQRAMGDIGGTLGGEGATSDPLGLRN